MKLFWWQSNNKEKEEISFSSAKISLTENKYFCCCRRSISMSRIVVITVKLFLSFLCAKKPQNHDNEATIMIKYSMKPHHFLFYLLSLSLLLLMYSLLRLVYAQIFPPTQSRAEMKCLCDGSLFCRKIFTLVGVVFFPLNANVREEGGNVRLCNFMID